MSTDTVARVRQRFVEDSLEAALARKKAARPPVPPKLDGRAEARLITLACSPPPDGRVRWTMQLLADKLVELAVVDAISDETVDTDLLFRWFLDMPPGDDTFDPTTFTHNQGCCTTNP